MGSERAKIPLREMFRAATAGALEPDSADAMLDDSFDAIVGRRGADGVMVWDRLSAQLHERLSREVGIWRSEMMIERVAAGVRVALRFGTRSQGLVGVALVLVGYSRRTAAEIADAAGISCAVARDLAAIQAAVRRRVVNEGVLVAIDPADAIAFPALVAAVRDSGAAVVVAGASEDQRALAADLLGDRLILLAPSESPQTLAALLRDVFAAW